MTTSDIIQEKTSNMTDSKLPLTYKHNCCYLNAYINKREAYKDLNLKFVIGSLGVYGWFEFGGKNWKWKDFQKRIVGHSSDSHCWLEDKDGNVYDYLFEEYNYWVKHNTGKKLPRVGLLEAVSKEDLKKIGIEYIPAPKDTQTALFLNCKDYMYECYNGLKTGKSVWNGKYLADVFEDETDMIIKFLENPTKYGPEANPVLESLMKAVKTHINNTNSPLMDYLKQRPDFEKLLVDASKDTISTIYKKHNP